MTGKTKQTKTDYSTVLDRSYRPTKKDMERDVSVPVSPQCLAKATLKGGAKRREKKG